MVSSTAADNPRVIYGIPIHPYFTDMPLGILFKSGSYQYLAFRIVTGKYVTKAQIRAARVSNNGVPVPDIILEYERRMARGQIKRPGRNRAGPQRLFATVLARSKYPVLLRRLKWRLRHGGLRGWSATRNKDWWQGSPHEIAAKMIRARYFKHCDWPYVLNLIHEDENKR